MGSVTDFGTRAGDRTPEWSSVSYNWNFVTYMFPNLSTWHSLTMIKQTLSYVTYCHTATFTCKKKKKNTPQCFCNCWSGALDRY